MSDYKNCELNKLVTDDEGLVTDNKFVNNLVSQLVCVCVWLMYQRRIIFFFKYKSKFDSSEVRFCTSLVIFIATN